MDRAARGRAAEEAVARHLERAGYDLLARNLRLGHLEVDLVATKGALAVMVEVRTRGKGAFERAFASVAGKKRARLLMAADRLWRFHLAKTPGVERMRIDVASVTFDDDGASHVEYIEGAITA